MTGDLFLSALAAPFVSGLVAFLIARAQIRIKMRELEHFYLDLASRTESQRQGQLQEVLRARITSYPILWSHIVEHTINWPHHRRERDAKWAIEFLEAIDEWYAANGVFLSEPSYRRFHEFRSCLSRLARRLHEGEVATFDEYREVYEVFSGSEGSQESGLATQLKNDLGSYRNVAIQHSGSGLSSGPLKSL